MLSKISFYFKKDENYHHFLNTCVLGPINIIKKTTITIHINTIIILIQISVHII